MDAEVRDPVGLGHTGLERLLLIVAFTSDQMPFIVRFQAKEWQAETTLDCVSDQRGTKREAEIVSRQLSAPVSPRQESSGLHFTSPLDSTSTFRLDQGGIWKYYCEESQLDSTEWMWHVGGREEFELSLWKHPPDGAWGTRCY